MFTRLIFRLALMFLVAAGSACTDAEVFENPGLGKGQADNKLTVKGGFCTEHPDELKFPVKIMFIIDCSQSMIVTDPPPSPNDYPGRVRAVWEVIQKFRHDPGISFAILRFEGAANVATQRDTNGDGVADIFGFVNDLPSLLRALNSLNAAGGNTSYQAALGLAEATIAMDMSTSSVDERARTKYVIIFLSDGFPYPIDYDDEVNTPASIRRALREMMNLPKRFDTADFTFHTALLSVNMLNEAKQKAESLLKDMAEIGNGTYRNFANGEEINFLDIDYTSVKRMYAMKDGAFLVSNLNAHPGWDHSESVDTDGDGLVDLLEEEIGTSIGRRDTDQDGFNDQLEYNLRQSGFDPLNGDDADCSLALDRLDRDGDGLLDCEERFIGTSPELFDTDADGMPDPVEYRARTNPVGEDAHIDRDADGSLNGQELAWHTNPNADDTDQYSKLAYRYRFSRLPGIFESRLCYKFEVDNITLVGTQARNPEIPDDPIGYNDIMVYAGQVPQDDPTDYGTFRVACARVRYIPRYPEEDIKIPPSGVVRFEAKHFKKPVATMCASDSDCPHHVCDPRNHLCLAPLGDFCDEETPCPNFTCQVDPNTNLGTCVYPVQVACLGPEDCPLYPQDLATGLCLGDDSNPDPVTGLCPRRECIPQYFSCDPAVGCPDDEDQNPDNDPVCLGPDDYGSYYCRVPCLDAGDCNPGETCETENIDGSQYCVDHHGGSCAGIPCTSDADCPVQPCDSEVRKCRVQPCLDSRECPSLACELVQGFCMGISCEEDLDCRGERGYTCNPVIGDPCDRDIDCPFDFCTEERRSCFYGGEDCSSNTDCPGNVCPSGAGSACLQDSDCPSGMSCLSDVCVGTCTLDRAVPCSEDLDCSPNYCRTYYVCGNDPSKGCTMSLDCPQTFCKLTDPDNPIVGTCLNNPNQSCNPEEENEENLCDVGMCSRDLKPGTDDEYLGRCDTLEREECSVRDDCPNYRCNRSLSQCYYPVEVPCSERCPERDAAGNCESGWVCGTSGFWVQSCSSDTDCSHARCQGRCVPMDPVNRKRCSDWFDPDRDCITFE